MATFRIGLAAPAKNPALGNVKGNGFLPQAVHDEFIALLKADSRISDIVSCDFASCHVANGKVYQGDECLSDLDLVFWFQYTDSNPASYSNIILSTLARTTRVIPDPAPLAVARDKFHAHTALRNAGIETADFALFQSSAVHAVAEKISGKGDILLKPTLGDFGQGIHRVSGKRALIDAVEYAQSFSPTELQIFCEVFEDNDLDRWISTTVIDGQLVYGYKKKPETFVDGWKVYDADRQGGHIDYVDPAPVREIVNRAIPVLGCDIIGFDFIYSARRKKYLVVDENIFPGMYPVCFDASRSGSWAEHFARMIFKRLPQTKEKAALKSG